MSVYERRAPFRPWDDRSKPNLLPAAEEGRRVLALAWVERRTAEVLREVAKGAPEVAATLERVAGQCDWHATVWEEHLLPEGTTATPGKLPTEGPSLSATHDLFDRVGDGADLLERLAGLSRVALPRLIAACTFHRSAVGTDMAPEAGRWLDIVLDDLHDARREIELVVQVLLSSPEDAERVAAVTSRLETPLVEAGGLLGPGTLGTT